MKRIGAVLLAALLLTPSLAAAQQSRAGVVTTLEGTVSARRVALPDPVPLKFKDDVFLQDTVTTGDKSLARMLLGGKAVVTVRERSVLTITETPGRSTIELETGKFALAVARERMRPGEEIQIRTPNAVAGVRGTVVITEVNRQSAQLGGAAASVLTRFYVLRGSITAQPLDLGTRQPLGTPLPVGAMQAYSGAGAAAPRVQPVPPEQVGQITAGLQPSGPKGGEGTGQEQVKAQAVETAVALLGTLTGTGSTQMAAIVAPPTSTLAQAPEPVKAELGICKTEQGCATLVTAVAEAAQQAPGGGDLLAGSILLDQAARLFSEPFSSTSPDPLLRVQNASLVQVAEGLDFVQVRPGALVELAGPLATFVDSSLITVGSLLDLVGGSLASTSTAPFFALDPTLIFTGDAAITMTGGSLSLHGPLLTDVDGVLVANGPLVRLRDGATLTGHSPEPLVELSGTLVSTIGALSLTGSTMHLAGPLVRATGVGVFDDGTLTDTDALFKITASTLASSSASPLVRFIEMDLEHGENVVRVTSGSTVSLGGPLLQFTDVRLAASNEERSLIVVNDGSQVVTTGTGEPLLSFLGTGPGTSQIAAARNFLGAGINTGSTAPTLHLSGPLLFAQNTSFSAGDPTSNTFSFLFFGDGTQVTGTGTFPFMSFTDSAVDTAGNILSLRRSRPGTPTRLTLAGPLLTATNSSFNHTSLGFGEQFGTSNSACCNAFFIGQGAELTSTTSQALIQLTNSVVTGNDAQSGGNFFDVLETFSGAGSELVAPGTVSLQGPLLQTSGSTVSALFSLVRVQRSSLSSTSPSPLIDVSNGSVLLGGTNPVNGQAAIGNLLFVVSGFTSGQANFPASVSLGGPLARFVNSTYSSGAGNVVSIINGASFTGGPGAMLQFENSTATGFNLINMGGLGGPTGTSKATLSLAGPILSATNSTITLGSNVVGVFNGSSVTSTTSAPLVQISNSSLTAGTSFNAAEVLQINGGTSPSLVTLNGPVFSALNESILNVPGALLGTFGGGQLVVNGSTEPLFFLTAGSHFFGNGEVFGADTAFSLNGLATETVVENVDEGCCGNDSILELGTRKPVQAAGGLLELSGATASANSVVKLDTALLEATAPVLNMKLGSTFLVSSDAVDLVQKARLTTSAVNPLIKLDASNLTILNGAPVAVRGGSFLNVGGDILAINNGSTLNINNGTLLLASGSSVVKAQGSLINFGGTGNAVNINNNLCAAGGCPTIGGLKVFLTNGAVSGNVSITTPITNPGGGVINLSNGGNTAHITVDGANTKVQLGLGF